MWDVGGQDKIRPLWRHYFQNTQGEGDLSQLAVVSVNITAYSRLRFCIKDYIKTGQGMTHTPLFNSQRACCVTPTISSNWIHQNMLWHSKLTPLGISYWWCNLQVNSQPNLYCYSFKHEFLFPSSTKTPFGPAVAPPCFHCMHQTNIQLQQTAPSTHWVPGCEIERVNPVANDWLDSIINQKRTQEYSRNSISSEYVGVLSSKYIWILINAIKQMTILS